MFIQCVEIIASMVATNETTIEEPTDDDQSSLANTGTATGWFQPNQRHILIDSGATAHFTGRSDLLQNPYNISPRKVVTIAGDKIVKEAGRLSVNASTKLTGVKYI